MFKNNTMVYVTSVPLEKGMKRHIISCNGVNCEVDEIDARYGTARLEIAYQYKGCLLYTSPSPRD